MKFKLLIPFLLLAILPVGMLAWMGRRMVKAEEAELERNLDHVYRGKLRDHDATIRKVLDSRRRMLLKVVDSLPEGFGTKELRTLSRTQSGVRQLFLLDDRSRLTFPPMDQARTTAEGNFLKRTASLWNSKLIPAAAGAIADERDAWVSDQSMNPYKQQAPSQQSQQEQAPTAFGVGEGQETLKDQGWLTWFWENGINLMYWSRLPDGRVLGAEFDRASLIADIIAELPVTDPFEDDSQDERVTLLDANGKVVYQWGSYDAPAEALPSASLALSQPLSAWKLAYYPGPQAVLPGFGRSTAFTMTATLVALGLAFLALALFFFLEHTRAMREAATRVSFVNRVSHELKTPLTNIRMYAELLAAQMEDVDDKAMERLTIITGEAERLSRLIGNVLTFSRNERNKLTIHKSSASVDSVVDQVLERFSPSLDRAGVKASRTLNATDTVHLDSDAFEQILTNLLSNVEKYAADGGRVEITTGLANGVATISVADNGPGIPAKRARDVFKPFMRLDDRLSEGISGTGIGLGIARELARLHGGDLTLETVDKGACFKITLKVGEE